MDYVALIVVMNLLPFVVCYAGARMERRGVRTGRFLYLGCLLGAWAIAGIVVWLVPDHLRHGLLGALVIMAGMLVVYWYTGLLMACRLNDMGTSRYRWLAALAGFPIIGLLVPLVLGFLPAGGRSSLPVDVSPRTVD